MNPLNPNLVRCVLLRSKSAELVPGFVINWGVRNISVLVALRTELVLNERITLKFLRPSASAAAPLARISLRVVSIVWRGAGQIVGLSIRAVRRPAYRSAEHQQRNHAPGSTVS